MSAFEELGVMPELIRAIEAMDWLLPTPIQQEAIPLILGGGDVLAAAETGSGKTGAFCLPILQISHELLREESAGKATASSSTSGVVGPAIRMSVDDRDPIFAIAPDGVLCQARAEKAWAGGRATVGFHTGKHYFEATVTDEGLCRVGWSTTAASLDLGTDKQGFGFGGTGKKSNNRQFDDYGEAFGKNDTVGCYLDCDNHGVYFSKNGKLFPRAFDIPQNLHTASFYPALLLKNAEMLLNFGNQPFRFPPLGGHQGCAAAPASQSSLSAPASARGNSSSGTIRKPLILVVEPTRELAEQVSDEISKFKTHLSNPSIEHVLCAGGSDAGEMTAALRKGVDIAVGTPGRLVDVIESGKLDLSNVRFFVLDEADRLIDPGNRDQIMMMFQKIPKASRKMQVLMFSATLHSSEIKEMAERLTKFPTWVDLKGKDAVPETVHHAVFLVDPKQYRSWGSQDPRVPTDAVHRSDGTSSSQNTPESYSEGVKRLKPEFLMKIIESFNMDQCMIFCRTKVDCDNLESHFLALGGGRRFTGKMEKGKENPFSCVVLHSDRSPNERRSNLQAFKDGDVRFLICTDVAARGIDIKELPYVINMTLPDKSEDYIHRIGRVGRADAMGLAISLVATEKEKVWYHGCPSKGKSCSNTRLVAEGGCTIWYDEPQLLKDIEARLGGVKVTMMDTSFRLPFDTAAYGQAKGTAEANAVAAEHFAQLRPALAHLTDLETRAQRSFLAIRTRYSSFTPFVAGTPLQASPGPAATQSPTPAGKGKAKK